MNNIVKPNDMLVSTLVNGQVSIPELIANNITAENTQFLDPESYKNTKIVKQLFSDKNGTFNEDAFMKAYEAAASSYNELLNTQTYKNLESYVEYNKNDIFAPLESKKAAVSYEIERELNPQRRSHGISSLFEYGKSTQSMRELAQQSKIWDTENQVWLDKTALDRGILGSLFGQSLVYATWDEDGEHLDPLSGRTILHKKGDWKLNEKGQYYTETIGSRSGYGKTFVAAADTLTKEGSALNKIDVFDSDDLEKSVVGTTVKALFKVAPYLFPQTQMIWGGITAAVEMARVLPKFAKLAEGLIVGGDADDETAFTKAMHKWDNYMSKFSDSYSDKGQSSNWSYEKIADTVTDVFAQLYQMRAAASLSKLAVKDPTAQAIKKFLDDIFPGIVQRSLIDGKGLPNYSKEELKQLMEIAVQKSPEVKRAIEAQSKISSALSRAYMALSSSADVYEDALAGGYDRRMAGLAGVAATVGLYTIMGVNNLGTWFLDKGVGFSDAANRATLLKALRPYYDDVAKAVDTISAAGTKLEKQHLLGKLFGKLKKGIDSAWNSIRDDGSIYWQNALTESIEEVSEEAVMDATKGMFDFLSWAGLGKNSNASFGVAQDFLSGNFLERYAQSAVGGFMGGALFEVQQRKIEPMMKKWTLGITPDDTQASLIHEIANGRTEEIYKVIDELSGLDNESTATALDINGNPYFTSANGSMTRGEAVGKVLKSYVGILEGAIIDENANLTDDLLLQKAIRDHSAIKLLLAGGLDKLLISDFTHLASEITSIKSALAAKEKDQAKKDEESGLKEEKTKPAKPSEEEKEEAVKFDDKNYNGRNADELRALLEAKREELNDFLSGKNGEKYLYKTLAGASPEIKSAMGNLSLYDYTFLKYNKEFKDFHKSKGTVNKKTIEEEYNKWKEQSDAVKKFVLLGSEAYADFDKRFSSYITDYVNSRYKDIRKVVYDKVLSEGNFTLAGVGDEEGLLDDNGAYNDIKRIANALKSDSASVGEVTLLEIFSQDVLKLKSAAEAVLKANPEFVKLLKLAGKTDEEILNGLTTQILFVLENMNIDLLNGSALLGIIDGYFVESRNEVFDKIIKDYNIENIGQLLDWLLDNGVIQDPFAFDELLVITDINVMRDAFHGFVHTEMPDSINLGIASSILEEYIMSEDTIDGTIAARVEEYATRSILDKLVQISKNTENNRFFHVVEDNPFTETPYEEVVTLQPDHFKTLIDVVNTRFGEKPLKELVSEWALDFATKKINSLGQYPDLVLTPVKGRITDLESMTVENLAADITDLIMGQLEALHAYKLYETTSKKDSIQNPIYDSLSKIDMHLSESGKSKVIEVLKNQHYKLRKSEKFEDYMPKGEEKIQLQNALLALQMYRALLSGMRSGSLWVESPFAVNQQMLRYAEKTNTTLSREYETIDEDARILITRDLDLIENLIKGYLKLGERAYSSKTDLDIRIKKLFCLSLLDTINAKATAFTIEDFSLLPPDKDKLKYKEPEEALLFYAHTIFKNFNERFTTPAQKAAAIKHIVEKAGLKGVFDRSSKPSDLSKERATSSTMPDGNKAEDEFNLLLWLSSTLSADAYEFQYRYNLNFVSNEKNKVVPLFSLETAVWQAWAFVQDKKNIQLNGNKVNVHLAFFNECLTKDSNYVQAANMFFVNGITGAGKSSAVSGVLSRLCSDKIFFVTAANLVLQEKYLGHISRNYPEKEYIQSGAVWELLGKFLTKDGKTALKKLISFSRTATETHSYVTSFQDRFFKIRKLDESGDNVMVELDTEQLDKILDPKVVLKTVPEVVFIDEATQVDALTLQVLNYLADKYDFKVILAGDTTQRGLSSFGDTQAIKDLFMYRSPKLSLSIRALNNLKGSNNIKYNNLLNKYEDIITRDPNKGKEVFELEVLGDVAQHEIISYYLDDDVLTGDKFVESLQDSAADILLIAKLAKADKSKVMVITELNTDGSPANPNLNTFLQENGLTADDYELYSYEDTHYKAVQGSEADYVIVDDSYLKHKSNLKRGELLRSVYTFASRALKGSLVVLPVDTQRSIGLSNQKDRFTQPDEIPQLADLAKIKEARKKTIETVLNGYSPEKIELDSLNIEEVDGKKVATRRDAPKTTPSTSLKKLTKQASQEIETEDVFEEGLTEAEKAETEKALNNSGIIETTEVGMNTVTTTEEKPFTKPYDPTQPVRFYSGLDHVGLPELGSDSTKFDPIDGGTDLDFDNLIDSKRRVVYPHVATGHTRLMLAIANAKSKEDIVRSIEHDEYIVAFLLEAIPQAAISMGYTDLDSWDDDNKRQDYAEWFRDNVTIDDKYYVFAKKLEWKRDKPRITNNASFKDSVGEGGTVLYFGIHMLTNEPEGTPKLLNLYFSLGTMADRYNTKTKEKLDNEALQNLYERADADLQTRHFAAYKLDNTELYNLDASSTLWIRKRSDGADAFESIAEMERRGQIVDKEHIYLVDSSKVLVNGKWEYKALVIAALAGSVSADLRESAKKPDFQARLKALKDKHVDLGTGELKISGSYMTTVSSTFVTASEKDKAKICRRVVFLSPKRTKIAKVFEPLQHLNKNANTADMYWRTRLRYCRPYSQTQIISNLLDLMGAFDNDPIALLKYVLGWKLMFERKLTGKASGLFSKDRATLEALYEWVKTTPNITKELFEAKLSSLGHRILLHPFYMAFITHVEGDKYKMVNFSSASPKGTGTIKNDEGVDVLDYSKADAVLKLLNLETIPDSYACPPLGGKHSGNDINIIEEYDLIPKLSDYGISIQLSINEAENEIYMVRVPYNKLAHTGEVLGLYGYEVQSPTYMVTTNMIEKLTLISEERLFKADDAVRFPNRTTHRRVTEKPADFDPTKYTPEVLGKEDFIIDPKYSKYVNETVKYDYERVKTTSKRKGKKGKNKTKFKIKVDKHGKPKVKSRVFNGYKDGKFHIPATNSMGFEVRYWDIVQLWGDDTTSYFVSGIDKSDPKSIKIHISKAGNGSGDPLSMTSLGETAKSIPLEAVTKVLKRTVAKKEHIELDKYYKGNFDTVTLYARDRYGVVEKTSETFREMLEAAVDGENVPSLDFDEYYYILAPIENMPESKRRRYLDTPGGLDKKRKTTLIYSLDQLVEEYEKLDDQSEVDESMLGFSLFKVPRSYNKDNSLSPADIINTIEKKIVDLRVEKQLRSVFVQHHVFFDDSLHQEVVQEILKAEVTTEYNHDLYATMFSRPEEILIKKADGTLDWEAIKKARLKFISFTPELYWRLPRGSKDNKFPDNEFFVEPIHDASGTITEYRLYPSKAFYFDNNGKPKNLLSDKGQVTGQEFMSYISGGDYLEEAVDDLNNLLVGYSFTDKHGGLRFISYSDLTTKEEKDAYNYAKRTIQTENKNKPLLTYGNMTIVEVYKGLNGTVMLNLKYHNGEYKQMSLQEFMVSLGSVIIPFDIPRLDQGHTADIVDDILNPQPKDDTNQDNTSQDLEKSLGDEVLPTIIPDEPAADDTEPSSPENTTDNVITKESVKEAVKKLGVSGVGIVKAKSLIEAFLGSEDNLQFTDLVNLHSMLNNDPYRVGYGNALSVYGKLNDRHKQLLKEVLLGRLKFDSDPDKNSELESLFLTHMLNQATDKIEEMLDNLKCKNL